MKKWLATMLMRMPVVAVETDGSIFSVWSLRKEEKVFYFFLAVLCIAVVIYSLCLEI
jgi:cell division protein FtsL